VKGIPVTPLTLDVARRVIWFESPEQALVDPIRFMAYAMTYARHEDMRVIRRYVSDDDFREALDHAPAGIVDPRSWAYWNSKLGRYPPPPLPVRRFGIAADSGDGGPMPGSGNLEPREAPKFAPEDQQREARVAWQRIRQQEPRVLDLEETRRRAREAWNAEYGPKGKS
jgi:hypothetical protein